MGGDTAFKVVDDEGRTYLIRSDGNYIKFVKALSSKVKKELDPKKIELKFIDEEGDAILISSDDCLAEATATAKQKGMKTAKLTLSIPSSSSSSMALDSKTMAIAGGGVAAIIGIAAMVLLKGKK
jgi:hypothetical protein